MKRDILTSILLLVLWGIGHAALAAGLQHNGFAANAGQFRDQSGKVNPSVIYSKDFGGMKVQLRNDGFSYELYQVMPKWIDPATIPYKVVAVSANGDTSVSWLGKEEALKNKMYHYHRVDVQFVGCNPAVPLIPSLPEPSTDRWLSGNHNSQITKIQNYGEIRYKDIYPGIDLVCYANAENGGFKYDFVLGPGADPGQIRLEYQGTAGLSIDTEGNLNIQSRFGKITESIPLCYQESPDGKRTPVTGIHYELSGNTIGFQGAFPGNGKRVIDPAVNICWGTYYGGSGDDAGIAVIADTLGFIYMCGNTNSPENIATTGSYQDSLLLPQDGFFVKFDPAGQRIWGTYLDGITACDMDRSKTGEFVITGPGGIAKVDNAGNVLWAYNTQSVANAVCFDLSGNILAAGDSILKLTGTGSLLWRISHGGSGTQIKDLGCDSTGNLFVVGKTTDTLGISTAGSHQPVYGGGSPACILQAYNGALTIGSYGDGYIEKLDAEGNKIWCSYYGGSMFDEITGITVKKSGAFAVCGHTNSLNNIATQNTYQDSLAPFGGGYCFELVSIGYQDECELLGGWTLIDTCIFGCYHPKPYDTRAQSTDAFLARFDESGNRLWSTYYGDSYSEDFARISATPDFSTLVLAGMTTFTFYSGQTSKLSSQYNHQPSNGSGNTVFIGGFGGQGNRLWGTYYGGYEDRFIDYETNSFYNPPRDIWSMNSLCLYNEKNIVICGHTTNHTGVSASGSYQDTIYTNEHADAFLAKFSSSRLDSIINPNHQSVCTGDTITLSCTVTGQNIPAIRYQWQRNSLDIPDAINNSLVIPGISYADTGWYRCKIKDDDFSWITDSVQVSIRTDAAVTSIYHSIQGGIAFADFNNDQFPDLLCSSEIRINDSSDFDQAIAHPGIFPAVAFDDYDHDDRVDVISWNPSWNDRLHVRILHNDTGIFNLVESPGLNGICAWADFDNDGRAEGFKMVSTNFLYFYLVDFIGDTIIETSAGSGPWELYSACNLTTDVGDFDNDGDQDILLVGSNYYGCSAWTPAVIIKNDNGIFSCFNPGFPQELWFASAKWFDYDNDGDLDIAFFTCEQQLKENPTVIVYSNLAGNFAPAMTIHPGISDVSPILTTDYNKDGYTDLLIGNVILENTQNGFTEVPGSYGLAHTSLLDAVVAVGDIDNDDDPDLLSSTRIYRTENCDPQNTAPAAPAGLSDLVSNDTVILSWQRATDLQTPQMGLSYNLRVGTSPDGNDIMASMSDSAGHRKISASGNASLNKSYHLYHLPAGNYYWSVQAIDNSYIGGAFSVRDSFQIILSPRITVQPKGITACPGISDSLWIVAEDFFPLNYQWYRNGTLLPGKTSSRLLFDPVSVTDSGWYYCVISNFGKSTESEHVFLNAIDEFYFAPGQSVQPGYYSFSDLDSDGDLDLFSPALIYLNNLGVLGPGIPPNVNTGVLSFDANNDNRVDLLSFEGDSVRIYYSMGTEFQYSGISMPPALCGKFASGDVNNDGLQDVYISSGCYDQDPKYSKLFINRGSWFEADTNQFINLINGTEDLIDYDGDGDLDLFLTGFWYNSSNPYYSLRVVRLYQNNGGDFAEVSVSIPGVEASSSSWADYDADGDLDLVLNGLRNWWDSGGFLTKIYRNDTGTFTETAFQLPNTYPYPAYYDMRWTDFNDDGKWDIKWRQQILLQADTSFSFHSSTDAISFGDFNNDGHMDGICTDHLLVNQSCDSGNTIPSAPTGLVSTVLADSVFFSWDHSSDSETPGTGLTYNLRIGSTQGGNEVLSSGSNPDGFRKLVALGNVQSNTHWWLHNLQPGTYYWSVQAIDNSFAGGPFAPEQTFVVPQAYRTVHLTLFLEGLFNLSTGQMNKAQDENGNKFPGTVADKVQVLVARSEAPHTVTYFVTDADLNQDGSCTILVPATGNYYLVVRHRNSIETWSALPVSFAADTVYYNFSSVANSAFGDNLRNMDGVYTIWGGDVNQDGIVDSGDMNLIDNASTAITYGYVDEDVNGDGIVDGGDMNLADNNSTAIIMVVSP